jgi:ABC-2 type transport system permease protein
VTTALRALVRKDLRIFFSDRRAVIMSFVAPIVIASFFGYIFGGLGGAVNTSPIPVLIVDRDGSALSRGIGSSLERENAIGLKPATLDEARAAVRKGSAYVGIVIPANFQTAARLAFLTGSQKPEIDFLYDPSHSPEKGMVQGMVTGSVMQSLIGAQTGATKMPFGMHEEAVTARKGVQYNGYAHSFGGMGVQFILFMGIDAGIGVLLQRQRGLWKRFRAAPLSRSLLLGSRAISAAITAMLILLVIFGFARVVFGVRIDGSMAGFLGICAAFSLMTASFGLLIAALGKTPEATRGLAIFVTLIMVMLGGAWVPSFIFPQWLQKATIVMPTRWAVDGLDAMVWRGLPFSAAVGPIAVLLLSTAIFGVLAVTRFRWEAD